MTLGRALELLATTARSARRKEAIGTIKLSHDWTPQDAEKFDRDWARATDRLKRSGRPLDIPIVEESAMARDFAKKYGGWPPGEVAAFLKAWDRTTARLRSAGQGLNIPIVEKKKEELDICRKP